MPARRFYLVMVLVLLGPASLEAQQTRNHSTSSRSNSTQLTLPQAVEIDSATGTAYRGNERSSSTSKVSTRERSESLSLPPRPSSSGDAAQPLNVAASGNSKRPPIITMISSLGVVLGLFLLVAWFARRAVPKSSLPLPTEVVQVLGRSPLAHRQAMHLVRIGNKLLLICVTPQGAETLSEISDPHEVERLCAACERQRPNSVSASFQQLLTQIGNEPTTPGFLAPNA